MNPVWKRCSGQKLRKSSWRRGADFSPLPLGGARGVLVPGGHRPGPTEAAAETGAPPRRRGYGGGLSPVGGYKGAMVASGDRPSPTEAAAETLSPFEKKNNRKTIPPLTREHLGPPLYPPAAGPAQSPCGRPGPAPRALRPSGPRAGLPPPPCWPPKKERAPRRAPFLFSYLFSWSPTSMGYCRM